jgi:hypothetical protein
MPHDDVWLVSLNTDDQHTITMLTYQELLDAMEAAHEWLLMLSDDAEISEDAAGAADFMREALARLAIGEEAPMPRHVDRWLCVLLVRRGCGGRRGRQRQRAPG